jgi:hypothetical protein
VYVAHRTNRGLVHGLRGSRGPDHDPSTTGASGVGTADQQRRPHAADVGFSIPAAAVPSGQLLWAAADEDLLQLSMEDMSVLRLFYLLTCHRSSRSSRPYSRSNPKNRFPSMLTIVQCASSRQRRTLYLRRCISAFGGCEKSYGSPEEGRRVCWHKTSPRRKVLT